MFMDQVDNVSNIIMLACYGVLYRPSQGHISLNEGHSKNRQPHSENIGLSVFVCLLFQLV